MAERVEVLEIDLTEVQTEAKETGQTLKELRAEVKELRTTLENTEVGTEEFGKALTDLTVKQQELTNVTKSGIAAQKGSYNDLVNQMDLLKRQWRATADEAERAALGEQIGEINSKLKEMDASVGNFQRNVGNYRQELKQLKEQLLDLEEGTDEYNAALARASEISQKMQDVNEFVAQSANDLGDQIQQVTGVAAGMVGAFQTVQATLNLVGIESESIGKMVATMQNLMAITQGLTAVEGAIDKYKRLNETVKGLTVVQNLFNTSKKAGTVATTADTAASTADAAAKGALTTATTTATTATWSLNAAISANPLGAILIVITAAVTAVIGLGKAFMNLVDDTEDLSAANDVLEGSIKAINRETDQQVRLMQAEGAETEEVLAYQKKRIEGNIKEAQSNLALLKSKADKGWWDWITKGEQEEIDRATQILKDLETQLEDINLDIRVENIKANKQREKDEAKARDELNKSAKEALDERLRIEKEHLEKMKMLRRRADIDGMAKINADYQTSLDDLNRRKDEEYATLSRHLKGIKNLTLDEYNKIAEESNALLAKNGAYDENQFKAIVKKYTKATGLTYDAFKEIEKAITEEAKLIDEHYNHEADVLRNTFEVRALEEKQSLKESKDVWANYYEQGIINAETYNNVIAALEKEHLEGENATTTAILNNAENAMNELIKKRENAEEEWSRLRDKEMFAYDLKINDASFREDDIEVNRLVREQIAKEIELIGQQRDVYISLGMSVEELDNDLLVLKQTRDQLLKEDTSLKILAISDQIEGMRDIFSSINDIAGGMSDEWADVFDTIQEGLTKVAESVKKGETGWRRYTTMAAAGLGSVSSILLALADEQDESTETGFENQKKYQIAAAHMSMLEGIVSAVTSAFSPTNAWMTIYGQAAAAAAMSGAVITAGVMQINKIKQQTLESSGDSSISSPSFSALQGLGSGVQATTNVVGASVEGQTTDTRVYVLESDITSTQRNVQSVVSEATY